jgi:hypothetical protein
MDAVRLEWMRRACIVGLVVALGTLLWGCAEFGGGSTAELVDSESAPIWVAADAYPAGLLEAMPKGEGGEPPYVAGQLVVKLKRGKFTSAAISAVSTKQGAVLKGRINNLRLLLVTVPAGADLAAMQAKLAAQPDVESVTPNYVYGLFEDGAQAATPKAITNDPSYLYQWGMWRIRFNDIALSVLPATAPTVAVVDTGVDYYHPDLLGKVIKGPDYFDGDMEPMDTTGHGTHVAGIIAAINNNNIGVAGVSGSSRILAVRVGAFWIPVFSGAAGIVYAADTAGVKVINLSWGGRGGNVYLADAVAYAAAKGVLVVASAGNDNTTDPMYPASYPGVLSVGATDYDDLKTVFSEYGDTVDIAAPGFDIYSTTPVGGSLLYAPSYDWSSGTSMASPFVAGAAALVRGKWPTMTAQQTSDLLTSTGAPIGPDGTGDAFAAGVRRLDVYAAFMARLGTMPTAPGAIHGIIVDANTGLALQGATVTAKAGAITFSATTRSNGTFTLANVPPGAYSVVAAKATYVAASWSLLYGGMALVSSGAVDHPIFIALPKVQAADVYTAVLSWFGWGISELDSYLWLPGSLPLRNQYMVGFWDRGNVNSHPFARYLRDEAFEMPSRYWWPLFAEAVVFRPRYSGQYTFAVNDFNGGGDWPNCPAVVQLYKGGSLIGTYLAANATGSGVWWRVFTLNGPSGAPVALQELTDVFPGPYGGEFYTSASLQKRVVSAEPVPFGTVVPGNKK